MPRISDPCALVSVDRRGPHEAVIVPCLLGVWLLVGWLFAMGCVHPKTPDARSTDDTHPPVAVLMARLDVGQQVLDVALTLPPGLVDNDTRVLVDFVNEPFAKRPGGYRAFVTLASQHDAGVVLTRKAPTTLRYQVDLHHHEAGPEFGVDNVPHPTNGGWHVVGSAFIPRIRVVDSQSDEPGEDLVVSVDVQMDVPTGWRDIRSTQGRMTLQTARPTVYYVGDFHTHQVQVGNVTLVLVSSSLTEAAAEELLTLVAQAIAQLETHLGPLPATRKLLIYDRAEQGFDGGVIGDAVTILSSSTSRFTPAAPDAGLMIHELTHMWLRGEPWWWGEGFTTYVEHIVRYELTGLSEVEIAQSMADLYTWNYRPKRGEGPVHSADISWAYPAGAIVAYCLDTDLAAAGSSLGAVLKDARTRAGNETPGTDDLFAAVERVSNPVSKRLHALLNQTEPIEMVSCIERAGFQVELETISAYTPAAMALKILRVPSYSPQRAEVFAIRDGSPFQPGDIIESIQGESIERVVEIDRALARTRPGERVVAQVLRDGERLLVEFPLPGVSAEDRVEQTLMQVRKPSEDRH